MAKTLSDKGVETTVVSDSAVFAAGAYSRPLFGST
jgi:translation initiation factor 2B subunit (eIF-2B alpha/beta/delta family)